MKVNLSNEHDVEYNGELRFIDDIAEFVSWVWDEMKEDVKSKCLQPEITDATELVLFSPRRNNAWEERDGSIDPYGIARLKYAAWIITGAMNVGNAKYDADERCLSLIDLVDPDGEFFRISSTSTGEKRLTSTRACADCYGLVVYIPLSDPMSLE